MVQDLELKGDPVLFYLPLPLFFILSFLILPKVKGMGPGPSPLDPPVSPAPLLINDTGPLAYLLLALNYCFLPNFNYQKIRSKIKFLIDGWIE